MFWSLDLDTPDHRSLFNAVHQTLTTPTAPSTQPILVETLFHSPKSSYIELAHLIASGYTPSSRESLYDALRQKAAALGADAVLVMDIDHRIQQTDTVRGQSGGTIVRSTLNSGPTAWESDDVTAVAIRYKE